MKILDAVDEALTAFVKLHDVDGVHYCAKLAWNAGTWLAHIHLKCLVCAAAASLRFSRDQKQPSLLIILPYSLHHPALSTHPYQ